MSWVARDQKHFERLYRRREWLGGRIAEWPDESSYDSAEHASLTWALQRINPSALQALSSPPVVVGDPEPATAENVESPRLGGQHLDRGAAAARAPQSAPDSVLSHQSGLRSADLDHTLANLDGETQR